MPRLFPLPASDDSDDDMPQQIPNTPFGGLGYGLLQGWEQGRRKKRQAAETQQMMDYIKSTGIKNPLLQNIGKLPSDLQGAILQAFIAQQFAPQKEGKDPTELSMFLKDPKIAKMSPQDQIAAFEHLKTGPTQDYRQQMEQDRKAGLDERKREDTYRNQMMSLIAGNTADFHNAETALRQSQQELTKNQQDFQHQYETDQQKEQKRQHFAADQVKARAMAEKIVQQRKGLFSKAEGMFTGADDEDAITLLQDQILKKMGHTDEEIVGAD